MYSHAAVEVHAINTNSRIIFDSQIDMLGDTEAKIPRVREVLLPQFVLLDLQTSLENLLGLWTSYRDVDCDLFVSSDAE